jgi:hypothetical protein
VKIKNPGLASEEFVLLVLSPKSPKQMFKYKELRVLNRRSTKKSILAK